MDLWNDSGDRLKREYELYRYLMDDYRLKYGLTESYPRRHDPDFTALYKPDGGQWCAVGRLISSKETGGDGSELYYAIEVPFDKGLIPALSSVFDYCRPAADVDAEHWLMLVIHEDVKIDTYRKLMSTGYEWQIKKAEEKKSLQRESVYQDVSIPRRSEIRHDNVPEKISQMRKLYEPKRSIPNDEAFCFYRQAVFMKDYQDHYDFKGTFVNIHPVYRMMTDAQLRGYFSWRTELMENGQLDERTPVAFLKLYVYELLMLLHSNAQDTYAQLCAIETMYPGNDRLFMLELHRWINDFAVYYGISDRIDDSHSWKILEEIGKDPDAYDDETLKRIMQELVLYSYSHSVFMKEHMDDVLEVLVRAYRAYCREYSEQGRSFFEEVVCYKISEVHQMFSSAVFYEKEKHPDCIIWLDDGSCFQCVKGYWQRNFYSMRSDFRKLMRETDRLMRLAMHDGRKLKQPEGLIFDSKILKETIVAYLQEKKEASRPKVNINMSSLSSIRFDAAVTRDSLLVEEEEESEAETVSAPVQEQSEEENHDTLFTAEERALLDTLLKQQDINTNEYKRCSAQCIDQSYMRQYQ